MRSTPWSNCSLTYSVTEGDRQRAHTTFHRNMDLVHDDNPQTAEERVEEEEGKGGGAAEEGARKPPWSPSPTPTLFEWIASSVCCCPGKERGRERRNSTLLIHLLPFPSSLHSPS